MIVGANCTAKKQPIRPRTQAPYDAQKNHQDLTAILLGVTTISLVLVLALVSVNLIDVDPKLKKALASKEPDIPDAQNAFFSMVALTAPSGENIHYAGIRE